MVQKLLIPVLIAGLYSVSVNASAAGFDIGSLIISRTTYQDIGDVASLKVGDLLSGGKTAVSDGSFPSVFSNEGPDPAFGVSSAIFLDQLNINSGSIEKTLTIDSSLMTSSFASKSELALNVSSDGSAITFMGYKAPVGKLDVSNSNTSAAFDSTNPVTSSYQRAVGQVNISTGSVTVTGVNAYSGNNGRAAVLANGNYYMVGNAGNGSATGTVLSQLSDNTGVQVISATNPGTGNTTAVGAALGTFGSANGYQHGFSLAQLPDPAKPGSNYVADKTGKDDNFRGMTVFNNTLYVTKGSGSNGVNSVYQVGNVGDLANANFNPSTAAITIMPGFNKLSEKVAEAPATLTATPHPFGIFFGDANTLFVADEGTGVRSASGAATGSLQMWTNTGGTWGLSKSFSDLLGTVTTPSGLAWKVKQDGFRNITGQTGADGSYNLFLTTATVSDESTHDLGADPNEVIKYVIDSNGNLISSSVVDAATAGSRIGGLTLLSSSSVAAVPESESYAMLLVGLGFMGFMSRRKAVK